MSTKMIRKTKEGLPHRAQLTWISPDCGPGPVWKRVVTSAAQMLGLSSCPSLFQISGKSRMSARISAPTLSPMSGKERRS